MLGRRYRIPSQGPGYRVRPLPRQLPRRPVLLALEPRRLPKRPVRRTQSLAGDPGDPEDLGSAFTPVGRAQSLARSQGGLVARRGGLARKEAPPLRLEPGRGCLASCTSQVTVNGVCYHS
jgi:hypothetical protein